MAETAETAVPAVRDLITACQDVFSMLPTTPLTIGTTRRLAVSRRVHIEIGTVVLKEWTTFANTDAMVLMVDELGLRDDYMALLYKTTGWLYTSSTFPIDDDESLHALSTALLQLRTLGVRFSSQLLASQLRTEMYGGDGGGGHNDGGPAITDVMLELYGSTSPPSTFDFGYSMFG